jgi:ATP-dependent helicase HrpA
VIEVALDRAFLAEPLPADAAAFRARLEAGRRPARAHRAGGARQAGVVLGEFAAASRKLQGQPAVEGRAGGHRQRSSLGWLGRRFLAQTPWAGAAAPAALPDAP